jgi:hypothetical protein
MTSLLDHATLTATAVGALNSHKVDVVGADGQPVGSVDGLGNVRDSSGQIAFAAPLQKGRKDRPLEIRFPIAPSGVAPLGEAKVASYKFGPRSKRMTLVVANAEGTELGRLEPNDPGDELRYTAATGGDPVATSTITIVKLGFIKRGRVNAITIRQDASPEDRQIALVTILRYDQVLSHVLGASRS